MNWWLTCKHPIQASLRFSYLIYRILRNAEIVYAKVTGTLNVPYEIASYPRKPGVGAEGHKYDAIQCAEETTCADTPQVCSNFTQNRRYPYRQSGIRVFIFHIIRPALLIFLSIN